MDIQQISPKKCLLFRGALQGYEITEDLKKWAAEKMVIFYKVLHPILIRKFK